MRMNGIVNDDDSVITYLDREFEEESDILPLGRKKDGSLSARSSALSEEELGEISRYVNLKIKEIGSEILEGRIGVTPSRQGMDTVCGFDGRIPGYHYRKLEGLKEEEAMQKIRERNEE